MLTLTNQFKDEFIYKDIKIKLILSYDNILLVFEMLEDSMLEPFEKILQLLSMVIININDIKNEINSDDIFELYEIIMTEYIIGDEIDDEQPEKNKIIDFTKDAELIYASFLMDYNIDLFKERGKLHWLQFQALLSNLSQDTPLGKAIHFRTIKESDFKDASPEQKKYIREMKRYYSLNKTTSVEEIDKKLESVASYLGGGGDK